MNKFLAALCMCACTAQAAPDFDDTSARYLNHGDAEWPELKVVAHVFPPFQYKKNGVIQGPMPEMMGMICQEAQVRCHLHMHGFTQAYDEASTGTADIFMVFQIMDNSDRAALFASSPPLIATSYSFFTSSTSNWAWKGAVADLDGRTVGTYGNSGTALIAQDVVSRAKDARLVREDSNLRAFQQLILGTYGQKAAVVANTDVGLALLKNANIYGPKPAGEIKKGVLGFGFSRASSRYDLSSRVIAAAVRLKASGAFNAVLERSGLKGAL